MEEALRGAHEQLARPRLHIVLQEVLQGGGGGGGGAHLGLKPKGLGGWGKSPEQAALLHLPAAGQRSCLWSGKNMLSPRNRFQYSLMITCYHPSPSSERDLTPVAGVSGRNVDLTA